ncbi:MAG: hypothetical protein ACK43M_20385 [Allorhizobium sp.]
MEPIEVKSIIGQVEAHNGELLVSFDFISDRPANHVVIFGEGTLYDLTEQIVNLYDTPGPFQINVEPSAPARQIEFETLGRNHESFPTPIVLKVSNIRIHLETPVLGIEFFENTESALFIFDGHSLGQFRSQLEQTAEAVRRQQR